MAWLSLAMAGKKEQEEMFERATKLIMGAVDTVLGLGSLIYIILFRKVA